MIGVRGSKDTPRSPVHTGYLMSVSARAFLSRREYFLLAAPVVPLLAQFSTGVRVVNVFVTVRDKQGKLVNNLTRDDFELTEDGRKQSLRYFSARSDLPITIGLLFDISGSQRSVIPEQREATAAFLRQVLRESTDQAFLLGFNQRIRQLEPLTGQRARIEDGLQRLDVPRDGAGQLLPEAQGTALNDAVAAASRILASQAGRKAMVVLSDGIDTASAVRVNAAIEAAQRADALIYPIRFYDLKVFAYDVPSPAIDHLREGKKVLERMARETGGGFLEVSGTQSLAANFSRLEEELRNQYSLGYTSAATGGSYRKIRVSVKPKGLTVQARDGYYPAE